MRETRRQRKCLHEERVVTTTAGLVRTVCNGCGAVTIDITEWESEFEMTEA